MVEVEVKMINGVDIIPKLETESEKEKYIESQECNIRFDLGLRREDKVTVIIT